ncbi:Uncharacterised protein [Mycobacteroides abscessus subsp. abscessus]|nr:Uncharacterised protein [Mycobacteroides abscessus subsp. abscessus]
MPTHHVTQLVQDDVLAMHGGGVAVVHHVVGGIGANQQAVHSAAREGVGDELDIAPAELTGAGADVLDRGQRFKPQV